MGWVSVNVLCSLHLSLQKFFSLMSLCTRLTVRVGHSCLCPAVSVCVHLSISMKYKIVCLIVAPLWPSHHGSVLCRSVSVSSSLWVEQCLSVCCPLCLSHCGSVLCPFVSVVSASVSSGAAALQPPSGGSRRTQN